MATRACTLLLLLTLASPREIVLPGLLATPAVNITKCKDIQYVEEEKVKELGCPGGNTSQYCPDTLPTEGDVLCAFVSFEENLKQMDPGKKEEPVYRNQEEALVAYTRFKECVSLVNSVNLNTEATFKAGLNFFCDMSEEQKSHYNGFLGN